MVETGIGRTAAAQLAPLADWLDIDSPESIPAAPMIGFRIEGDRLVLQNRPGLGLRRV
jgi:L-alanine-DL-glutamate epimerase-like enolase superfamily enzyme